MSGLKEGWALIFLGRSYTKKWHYIRYHRSLCGKYMVIGHPNCEQGNDESPDNCPSCAKKLKKEREKKLGD